MTQPAPKSRVNDRHKDFLTLFSDGDLIMMPAFQLDDYLAQLLGQDNRNESFLNYRAFLMLDEQHLALPPEVLVNKDETAADQRL